MKIITEDKAYVQWGDIMFLSGSRIKSSLPSTIVNSSFLEKFIRKNNKNIFIEFSDPNQVEFFRSLDCIVDYLAMKDLSIDEVSQYIYSIENMKAEIIKKFNFMDSEEMGNNVDVLTQCELLDFKMFSANDILLFKKGQLQVDLPECIYYPDVINPNLVDDKKDIKRKLKRFQKFSRKRS